MTASGQATTEPTEVASPPDVRSRSWPTWLAHLSNPVVAVVALVALSVVYAAAVQSRYPGASGGDAPYYILSARAWAGGSGFHPSDPTQTKFPPGWSLALMLGGTLFGESYASLARFTAALFPLVIGATWWFGRRRHGSTMAAFLAGALVLSPACFETATRGTRSEVLYTAASIGFLAWSEATFDRTRLGRLDWGVGAALLAATVLFRSIGIALILAVLVTAAHITLANRARGVQYVRHIAAPLVLAIGALGVWKVLARAPVAERYPGEFMSLYGSQFWLIDPHRPSVGTASIGDVLGRIPGNLKVLAAHAAELLANFGWISPSWTSPFVVAVIALVLAGLVRELRRELPLIGWYVLGYVGILSVWPFDEGLRFLIPVLSLLIFLAASGLRYFIDISRTAPRRVTRGVVVVALVELLAVAIDWHIHPTEFARQAVLALVSWLVLVVLGFVRLRLAPWGGEATALGRRVQLSYAVAYAILGVVGIGRIVVENIRSNVGIGTGFQQASDWIIANTDPQSVVMAQRHLDFEMTTGRPTAVFPVTADRAQLATAILKTGTRYLVAYATPIESAYYFPVEEDRVALIRDVLRERLQLRTRVHGVSIYEIVAR